MPVQSFYYDKKPMLGNEEFDNLKEELLWEGSKVAILRSASAWLTAYMAFWAPAHSQQRIGFIKMMNSLGPKQGPARRKCVAGMAAWRCCWSGSAICIHNILVRPVAAAEPYGCELSSRHSMPHA